MYQGYTNKSYNSIIRHTYGHLKNGRRSRTDVSLEKTDERQTNGREAAQHRQPYGGRDGGAWGRGPRRAQRGCEGTGCAGCWRGRGVGDGSLRRGAARRTEGRPPGGPAGGEEAARPTPPSEPAISRPAATWADENARPHGLRSEHAPQPAPRAGWGRLPGEALQGAQTSSPPRRSHGAREETGRTATQRGHMRHGAVPGEPGHRRPRTSQ